ncbi:hypothetical protein CQ054_20070 [Ochrobactrum sp. MYb29]|nr:hypothetical protein CQ054_20070 [Ochrobactrum sp. MYb29]
MANNRFADHLSLAIGIGRNDYTRCRFQSRSNIGKQLPLAVPLIGYKIKSARGRYQNVIRPFLPFRLYLTGLLKTKKMSTR